MIPYERQVKIVKLLQTNTLLKIDELKEKLPEVSISTLRRDLKELEKENKVQLLTGGAVKLNSSTTELPIKTKSTFYIEEKNHIADLAMEQVNDQDMVYIDSGSTCTILLEKMIYRNVHIVTSNTGIFNILNSVAAKITVLGGEYNPAISSLSGNLTEMNIGHFIFDKAFLGGNGIDLEYGITTPDLKEAMKKNHIVHHAKKSFLLCDSSKFHQVANVKSFDLDSVTLISDKGDAQLEEKTNIIF
ncbi:DeoR/GlpR family DNA-binding transcription regulator [Tetragenococcus solitarius]|uniref:DeoR/GlpR family DNA-binding transcription regulator n=1 Tax=Tetragenococcus solitarius TaxID=71453 RepID=A0ABN3Y9E3_9ENTE|nr:DeoR/GlpR family DNA-binding transcription regulator [Tetragenococcus solitarius]